MHGHINQYIFIIGALHTADGSNVAFVSRKCLISSMCFRGIDVFTWILKRAPNSTAKYYLFQHMLVLVLSPGRGGDVSQNIAHALSWKLLLQQSFAMNLFVLLSLPSFPSAFPTEGESSRAAFPKLWNKDPFRGAKGTKDSQRIAMLPQPSMTAANL